ncbi:hypothetical protein GGX14DRAFT_572606 [Mycena pura]|uniref:Uncharacterized protein n=1 Tax=Mycena pura TaxID=153505 RepID=A0AAD6V159_9AGAR|nr:hypothetical protein GGX14DRAFT_572606 [Mycena pura]
MSTTAAKATFDDATGIYVAYPTILPQGALSHADWHFNKTIPSVANAQLEPAEVIPCFSDITPILSEMPTAFMHGFRSISMSLCVNGALGGRVFQTYHFSKLELIRAANNNLEVFASASSLVAELGSFELPTGIYSDFLSLRVWDGVQGFCVAQFPLWKLSCFLKEEWLHEDIVNVLAELMYFRYAVLRVSPRPFQESIGPPKPSFENDYILDCFGNHYSTYEPTSSGDLEHSDSLHHVPDQTVVEIFDWLLPGSRYPTPQRPCSLDVERQGPHSGSCTAAALLFVENSINEHAEHWEDSCSSEFHCGMLHDLLLFDNIAGETLGSYTDWVHPCVPPLDLKDVPMDSGPVGYNNESHPIHRIMEFSRSPAPQTVPAPARLDLDWTPPPVPLLHDFLSAPHPKPQCLMPLFLKGLKPQTVKLLLTLDPKLGMTRLSIFVLYPQLPVQRALFLNKLSSTKARLLISHLLMLNKENSLPNLKLDVQPGSLTVVDSIALRAIFKECEDVLDSVSNRENLRGHLWCKGQTKCKADKFISRPTIKRDVHGASAALHMSMPLLFPAAGWSIVDWEHNHEPELPTSAVPPRAPSAAQRELAHLRPQATSLRDTLTNCSDCASLTTHLSQAAQEVDALGGDIQAVLAKPCDLKDSVSRWSYDFFLDENRVVKALWWQLPAQAEITARYPDILRERHG